MTPPVRSSVPLPPLFDKEETGSAGRVDCVVWQRCFTPLPRPGRVIISRFTPRSTATVDSSHPRWPPAPAIH